MNILVLGGTGMLGHKMFQQLRMRYPETYCTIRGSIHHAPLRDVELLNSGHVLEQYDFSNFTVMERVLLQYEPRVVVNCVGIIKQRDDSKKPVPSIAINSLLPHILRETCERIGAKLIHLSTDCVFKGQKGNYREDDLPDAEDLYGRTKFLGEVATGSALTLRTSIIGRELLHYKSLLEWFLGQNHKPVLGYTRALFSGVTTNYLAKIVGDLISDYPNLSGLYNVASQTISKFDLLCLLREAYGLDVEILPQDEFFCDRSLMGEKFTGSTGYVCPPWRELVSQLASDDTPYNEWRAVKNEVL